MKNKLILNQDKNDGVMVPTPEQGSVICILPEPIANSAIVVAKAIDFLATPFRRRAQKKQEALQQQYQAKLFLAAVSTPEGYELVMHALNFGIKTKQESIARKTELPALSEGTPKSGAAIPVGLVPDHDTKLVTDQELEALDLKNAEIIKDTLPNGKVFFRRKLPPHVCLKLLKA